MHAALCLDRTFRYSLPGRVYSCICPWLGARAKRKVSKYFFISSLYFTHYTNALYTLYKCFAIYIYTAYVKKYILLILFWWLVISSTSYTSKPERKAVGVAQAQEER